MRENANTNPITVFRVLDGEGRPIGRILQPRSRAVLGRGAGTVLLVREQPMKVQEIGPSRACA